MAEKMAVQYKDTLTLSFPWDEALVGKVRELPSRRFNPQERTWTLPVNNMTLRKAREWGFNLVCIDKPDDKAWESTDPYLVEQGVKAVIKTPLRPYQLEGVRLLNKFDGKAILADEPRLGKTLQAIAWVMTHQPLKTLVVCPATVKYVWQRQFKQHAGKVVLVGEGSTPNIPDLAPGQTLIVNYEMLVLRKKGSRRNEFLSAWGAWILKQGIDCIITDESTAIKCPTAKRSKAVRAICRKAKHMMFLSGTPIMSRPIEIFTPANLIDPISFANRWAFCMRYCAGKHNGFGWDFTGASHMDELHEVLQKFMIRRRKCDVLEELPEKEYAQIPVQLENKPEYDRAKRAFVQWVRQEKGLDAAEKAASGETIAKITALKHLAATGKLNSSIAWIEDFLESGKKLVVFAHHHDIIDQVAKALNKKGIGVVTLTGNTPTKQREWVIDKFQNDPKVPVIIGNIQAAGVGVDLSAADTALFLEFGWTPSEMDQAADRIFCFGETNKLMIYYMIALNTLEQDICDLLDEKRTVVRSVLDGGKADDIPLFRELLKRMLI